MASAVYKAEFDTLVDDLKRAEGDFTEDVITQILHSMGDEIADRAKTKVPKKTGELAASIAVYKGPMYVNVKAEAPHAAFVEFGTWSHSTINPRSGTYTIRPKKPGGVLRFTAKDGTVVYTRKVEHPGIEPQPYMKPAVDEVLEEYGEQVGNAGVVLILGDEA